jgi:hypothetical protein
LARGLEIETQIRYFSNLLLVQRPKGRRFAFFVIYLPFEI